MPRVPISDLDDPRIAVYRHLKATNATRDAGLFVVEGETLVDRLLASRFPADSVLATDRLEARIAAKVPADVPLFVVPDDRIGALVGFPFHRGVLASGRPRAWPDLGAILRAAGPRATLVICPGLDMPDNLGAILRTGHAFGVDAVLVGPSCPDPLSRRVIRVSMGAALRLPVFAPSDLEGTVDRLRADLGFDLVAAVSQSDAPPIGRVRRSDRQALLLGTEATGLGPGWLARADRRVTIPMSPGADSLNVAVAAGILLHYLAGDDASGRAKSPEPPMAGP
jgi:tRNA G18 (ribose-2'-O)-methylase SpoU